MNFFLDRVIPEKLARRPMKTIEIRGSWFARAQKLIPGGVNSPVRAFRGVGGTPRFIERGEGSRIFDVDGNSYIDYVGSWGPLLLGHRPPPVIDALREALEIGTSFGAPTEREVELAELIAQCRAVDRDGAAGELRHRSDHERAARWRADSPAAT